MGAVGDGYEDEYIYDRDLTADERVKAYVLREAQNDTRVHTCEQTVVSFLEGSDGSYGCETGCEFWRLDAKLTCPHLPAGIRFEYGQFGMLNDLLEAL